MLTNKCIENNNMIYHTGIVSSETKLTKKSSDHTFSTTFSPTPSSTSNPTLNPTFSPTWSPPSNPMSMQSSNIIYCKPFIKQYTPYELTIKV